MPLPSATAACAATASSILLGRPRFLNEYFFRRWGDGSVSPPREGQCHSGLAAAGGVGDPNWAVEAVPSTALPQLNLHPDRGGPGLLPGKAISASGSGSARVFPYGPGGTFQKD